MIKNIVMLAAENGALPGGKVGGIGDVVRDVPRALGASGREVTVLTPAYGVFASLPGAKKIASLDTGYGGAREAFTVYQVPLADKQDGVHHIVIDHPLFSSCGAGNIYCDDLPIRPFAADASKFALFCACAAQCIVKGLFGKPDAIHLHDWHAALLLVLRQYDPAYQSLKKIHCAYTIHNLAIQGIRPFAKDPSSLQQWFPELKFDNAKLADPRWPDCINPMATAIRLADRVHAVSPSYAEEILAPSDVKGSGYYGGEGLELDLAVARKEGRLFGILNGCEYPKKKPKPEIASWKALQADLPRQLLLLASAQSQMHSAHFIAQARVDSLAVKRPPMLITSVGRVTEQKVGLLKQHTSAGRTSLDALLDTLGDSGLLLMVGSGDTQDELFLTRVAARHSNFIFLRGYSDQLAETLYYLGDLFLMPSSFEPCGISQMLALRAGQPCLVHAVGGLRDTVEDGKTGFSFSGKTPVTQADNLVKALQRAIKMFNQQPDKWQAMRKAATSKRFAWADSIKAYLKQLYR